MNDEGEFQAGEKMVQAAAMINNGPIALQPRLLQPMQEISSGHNTATFLPVPIDLFSPLLDKIVSGRKRGVSLSQRVMCERLGHTGR